MRTRKNEEKHDRRLSAVSRCLTAAALAAAIAAGCGASGTGGSTSAAAPTAASNAAQTAAATAAQTTASTTVQTASGKKEEAFTRDFFAMDTFMSLKAYGPNAEAALTAAEAEVHRLDDLLSTGNPESEIAKLNASGSGILSGDTKELVRRSLETAEQTGGAFDIAIYPVMNAWGFYSDRKRVPSDQELAELLKLCDVNNIVFDAGTGEISFKVPGMAVDLGGAAKGYTSAQIMEIFRENGITSGSVNLGGNVQVLGAKPDGSDWKIGVDDPDGSGMAGVLKIRDRAVITSGGYERYFEENGQIYHHIIDPATGKPAYNGLKSVTIVTEDGTAGDMLSTSLFILGTEKAKTFCREHSGEFDAVLITDEDEILITPGLEKSFTSKGRKAAVIR